MQAGAILSGRMAARAILGGTYALYGERDPMPWGLDDPSPGDE